jgi:uncharacterized membrane protein YtjA (UPF0391 family)
MVDRVKTLTLATTAVWRKLFRTRASGWIWNNLAEAGVFLPSRSTATVRKGTVMLGWAVTFLIIALVAAVLGFGGIAGVAIEAAKLVFVVAIILFAIAAVVGLVRGRTPRLP